MDQNAPFSLFGFGRDGLPEEVDLWIASGGGTEAIAYDIIDRWHRWAEDNGVRGRRRTADSQLAELNTEVFLLVDYHRKHATPLPPAVTNALAVVLGLISAKTGAPLPAAAVREALGLPDVEKMDNWLQAALLDGRADAAGKPLSVNGLADQMGVARDSIRRWRQMPEYQRRRTFAGQLKV